MQLFVDLVFSKKKTNVQLNEELKRKIEWKCICELRYKEVIKIEIKIETFK